MECLFAIALCKSPREKGNKNVKRPFPLRAFSLVEEKRPINEHDQWNCNSKARGQKGARLVGSMASYVTLLSHCVVHLTLM